MDGKGLKLSGGVKIPAFAPVAILTTADGTVAGAGILEGYTHFRCCTSDVTYNFNNTGTSAPISAGLVTALTKGFTFKGIYVVEVM